ncbi:MAG: hypothetical protein U0X71_04645 [Sphingobacteriaceae bacterium]|nr:MAG: hypothetical protein E6Q66_04545 [Pedobacter sp.]
MKCIIAFGCLFFASIVCGWGQQYALYNSRTLYDAFENPSQKAFHADSSFKYAFTFFFPAFAGNGSVVGPSTDFFRRSIFKKETDVSQLNPNESAPNVVNVNANIYLLMFRVFTDVQFDQEIGFSWQLRNESRAELTNGMLILAKNHNLFVDSANYYDILNGTSYSQSYHQFSLTYRRNHTYNGRLGWGVKLSYLDGINYDNLVTQDSYLARHDPYLHLRVNGLYKTSHPYDNFNVIDNGSTFARPTFKNPGFSMTWSANLRLRKDWYLMGNLKDIGFITWNNAYEYDLGLFNMTLFPAPPGTSLESQLSDRLSRRLTRKSFTSFTNGKLELLAAKDMGVYQPNFIFSKSLFYPGSDWVFVNNVHVNNMVFSLFADYNQDTALQLGGQFMIQSPNFEFYMGSNQLLGTDQWLDGLASKNVGSGPILSSIYMGLGIKFGRVMYHRADSPVIPGF